MVLTGTIKTLSGSVLMLSTSFTKDPISLKWSEISGIKTEKLFKVMDRRGKLTIGQIILDSSNATQFFIKSDNNILIFNKEEIGQITKYDPKNLKDKLDIHLDIGFVTAKANNARQLSFGTRVRYEAKKWVLLFDYSTFASIVDTIITSRGNLGISAAYILPKNWFVSAKANFFSSSEQQLDLRATNSFGVGKYIFRKASHELRIISGGSHNLEKFTLSPEEFRSAELFGSIHHEYVLTKGLNLLTDLIVSPSITEQNRIRTFFSSEAKITIIKHFRFGLGYTLNYDNKPPVLSSKSDYILNFKLGWSFQ
jgi:putative salt-induced outer membrane protein YdiY